LSDRPQQQHITRAGERDPSTNARQAAEALFAPKQPLSGQPVAETPRPAGETVRKPRVLTVSAAPTTAQHELSDPQAKAEKQTAGKISRSQFSRIRTWQQYGMTAQQIADMYGVSVAEIELIARAP
jgi:hypothetical protein